MEHRSESSTRSGGMTVNGLSNSGESSWSVGFLKTYPTFGFLLCQVGRTVESDNQLSSKVELVSHQVAFFFFLCIVGLDLVIATVSPFAFPATSIELDDQLRREGCRWRPWTNSPPDKARFLASASGGKRSEPAGLQLTEDVH